MSGLLLEHAVRTIWCEPIRDRQEYLALARLTKSAVSKYVTVLWERISLPEVSGLTRPLFHVYQIGALDSSVFDISTLTKDVWFGLESVIVSNDVVVDIFFFNGCKVPPSTVYIRQNTDGNLILAIQYLPLTEYLGSNIDQDTLYCRFYANALYDSTEWRADSSNPDAPIKIASANIKNQTDFANFISSVNAILATHGSEGFGLYYVDGYLSSNITAYHTKFLNRVLTFVWDSSIRLIQNFAISQTPTFSSVIDPNIEKYLLLVDLVYDTIDFFDDVDIYLVNTDVDVVGVYLGRLSKETHRQVTHNSYSVSKRKVKDVLNSIGWLDLSKVTIRLVVRKGGLDRGLFRQHNRVEELYKLTYNQIIEAMVTNPTVPEWLASTLENSAYVRIMGSQIDDIDSAMAEEAYGYNAATRAIANPLCKVDATGTPYVELPPLLTEKDINTNNGRRVFYHYKDGLLRGYINNSARDINYYLSPTYDDCDLVEAFNYTALVKNAGTIYDQDITDSRLKQYGFRCYVSPLIGGIPSEVWYDVTNGPYYYYNEVGDSGNGYLPELVWDYGLLSAANLFPCVRINDIQYVYTAPPLTPNFTGYIQFELLEDVVWFGTPSTRRMRISFGVLDVFMDGYSLIRNLDYYVDDGLITVTKRPATDPEDTVIFVRGYGFPNPQTMVTDLPREQNFVKGGILSVNGSYDIRNDRNIRIVVEGLLKPRDSVKFTENMSGVLSTDGRPYSITDYAIPVENFTGKDFIDYRSRSIDLDDRVMEYLTLRLPEPVTPPAIIVTDRWDLVSPFCSAVLHALLDGLLSAGELNGAYTDSQVDAWLAGFLPLLEVDPCVREIDHRYVIIYPHPYKFIVSVTNSQYRFLEYLIARFLFNRTDLTPSLFIE